MPHFTTTDGLNLYYRDEGQGQPVLCLAGLTRNSDDFNFVASHLAHVRLIRMDYRGRGQSDYDPVYTNYNIVREGMDATELLDHLGLGKATILGTSRGGLIAMALAVGCKDRLCGVILNDIGPVIEPVGLERIMDYVGREPNQSNLSEGALALAKISAKEFPGVPVERWQAQMANMFYEKPDGGLGLRYDTHLRDALLEQSSNAAPPNLWDWFAALEGIPTGVIRGANSDLLTRETFAEMSRRHNNLVASTVPNRGHVPFLDEPEALKVISGILERTALP